MLLSEEMVLCWASNCGWFSPWSASLSRSWDDAMAETQRWSKKRGRGFCLGPLSLSLTLSHDMIADVTPVRTRFLFLSLLRRKPPCADGVWRVGMVVPSWNEGPPHMRCLARRIFKSPDGLFATYGEVFRFYFSAWNSAIPYVLMVGCCEIL